VLRQASALASHGAAISVALARRRQTLPGGVWRLSAPLAVLVRLAADPWTLVSVLRSSMMQFLAKAAHTIVTSLLFAGPVATQSASARADFRVVLTSVGRIPSDFGRTALTITPVS
jgi:hypothetical protein